MTNENDLMQKLLISKKIMEKHSEMPRNIDGANISHRINQPQVESFNAPEAKFNIPNEYMHESSQVKTQQYTNSNDRILSSKLPDAIKQLMIEHPINQPNTMSGPVLSDELVERAARLMSSDASGKSTNQKQQNTKYESVSDIRNLKTILREVVEEVLSENGLLIESTQKSNDTFSFKVGKHIFEGKVTKVKKIQ